MVPAASERVDQLYTVITLMDQIAQKLELRPVVAHNPMTPAMFDRGTVTRSISRHVVVALAIVEADGSPPRVAPHEDEDTDKGSSHYMSQACKNGIALDGPRTE